jgi:hypothetical protein
MEKVEVAPKIRASINYFTKMRIAALWENHYKEEVSHDPNHRAFIREMRYRKEIASRYLSEDHTDESMRNLEEMFERCNESLKKILGI